MQTKCNNCGAEIDVGDTLSTADCPFCGSSSIVERPAGEVERPAYAIGFALERDAAVEHLRKWIVGNRNFLHIDMDFVLQAIERELKGIYLPAYMLGARTDTSYRARIGEHYTETTTYTGSDGKTHTKTETKTEWRSLTGRVVEYLPDVLVTGSRGVANETLERIEPYDYAMLRRFDPRLTSGWISEIPTRSRDEVIQLAKGEAEEKIRARLGGFMPGDCVGDISTDTTYSDATLDMLQVPIWSLRVPRKEGEEPIHILVNGQTGKVGGKIPYSGLRIFLFVAAIACVVAGLLYAAGAFD